MEFDVKTIVVSSANVKSLCFAFMSNLFIWGGVNTVCAESDCLDIPWLGSVISAKTRAIISRYCERATELIGCKPLIERRSN